jgi:hypothetical protein
MRGIRIFAILAAFCLVCLVAGLALAQSGDTFELRQFAIEDGGGASSGGSFALRGTIGQADAGKSGGVSFKVNGGFWHKLGSDIFLPVVIQVNPVR